MSLWHYMLLWGAVVVNLLCAAFLRCEALRYRRMAQDLQAYLWTEHGVHWEEE